jgi:hypothetical protein
MASRESTHTCHFMLEQNAKGYFTGNFICTYCGQKVSQSQWFDSLTATSSGREPSQGLSRTTPQSSRQ